MRIFLFEYEITNGFFLISTKTTCLGKNDS